MINKNFEKTCIEFLKKFHKDYSYMNPHWKKIESSIPEISLSENLDKIVMDLNKKDKTKYLNKNFDRNLANDIISEKYELYDEQTASSFKFLRIKKILENYLKQLEYLDWSPQMVSARHYYYANLLKKYLLKNGKNEMSKIRVLEIGGGTGQLVIFLRKFFDIDYVNIDFAGMLVLNAFENRNISNTQFVYNIKDYKNIFKNNSSRYIIPKVFLENIEAFKHFDVYLNCHSLMEMDKKVRNKYILASNKVLRGGGAFF
jgi:SAM-dependent methyltransferase